MIAEGEILGQLLPKGCVACLKQREGLTNTLFYGAPKIEPRWFRLLSEGTNFGTDYGNAYDREHCRDDCKREYANQSRLSSERHLDSP